MGALKGYRQTRLLKAARLSAWAAAGLFGLLSAWQVASLVLAFETGSAPSGTGPGTAPEKAAPREAPLPEIGRFAVIWQKMDPNREKQTAGPTPPPDAYPEMRLLATVIEAGNNYALLQVKRGTNKLLREGQAFEDIKVLEVKDKEATVAVPNYKKVLKIER